MPRVGPGIAIDLGADAALIWAHADWRAVIHCLIHVLISVGSQNLGLSHQCHPVLESKFQGQIRLSFELGIVSSRVLNSTKYWRNTCGKKDIKCSSKSS